MLLALGLATHLLARMKGAECKAALQRLIAAGRLDKIPDYLAQSALEPEEARSRPKFLARAARRWQSPAMNRLERFYKIDQLLHERRVVSRAAFRGDRELVLEFLRHGGDVDVLLPTRLRRKVQTAHADAAKLNA